MVRRKWKSGWPKIRQGLTLPEACVGSRLEIGPPPFGVRPSQHYSERLLSAGVLSPTP